MLVTHVGTATLLLEIGELRLLTDPVFDPPGGRYSFGWGTGSTKLTGPALPASAVGRIDAVLLSHDHHDDNLDQAGRALLPGAGRVLTTKAGARRLGGNAEGLGPWQSTVLEAGATRVKVTAVPSQHGPWFALPFAGPTLGFVLEWQGQNHGAVYVSGDTVYFRGMEQIAERFAVSVAFLHAGKAGFPLTGPIGFTLDASGAVKAARRLKAHTVVPIHYEGWKHFTQGRPALEDQFTKGGLQGRLAWLPLGTPTRMEV